ncbi:hypothetical protein HALLA_18500 [Halostagnicola larsenii XH-48]|uniref:Uncharacterized protein n=1 Tax=Halostagnicola larsenii XH-48 TaxID=797299 RepID=W0JT60_9EURY|nr:DUF6360 family protein [Halostagnicola larsenii]AHG00492.1 hypothetical protein HALLA_18500 [Halostagnicola larsenii XH-48]
MANRLLSVTAHTTLDYVDAIATGYEFEFESVAVVNATADREDPDDVQLQVELDNRAEEYFPAHTVELQLGPEQARELAGELEEYAQRVEDGSADN